MATKLTRNGEIYLVPVSEIIVDEAKNNTRVDYGDIEGLAESIKNSGLKNPILLKKERGKDEYHLVHGHRRMRAINHLIKLGVEYPKVRAILVPKDYNQDNVLLDMLTLNDGKPLSVYEQGLVFVQLIDRGFKEKEIAEKVGRSVKFVRDGMEMAKLPKSIQNEIAEGTISGYTAVEIAKVAGDEDKAVETVKNAIDEAKKENGGKKKKATARHAKVGGTPFKTLERVCELLTQLEINTEGAILFKRAMKLAKMKEAPEKIFEIFDNEVE
jgi:ParB family chromosome partitioning protein